jgi:hypothetical protein
MKGVVAAVLGDDPSPLSSQRNGAELGPALDSESV